MYHFMGVTALFLLDLIISATKLKPLTLCSTVTEIFKRVIENKQLLTH